MLYEERYRPRFHFSAPKGWLNDPNGAVWYKGEYHLFYQYHPDDIFWGPMHWGHAVSRDLVHWENLPIALYPDENGTIFSGTVVIDESDQTGFFDGGEGMVAFYTGHIDRPGQHPIEHQCIAYSKDCGRTWEKYSGNPIISAPDTPDAYDFRDPKVFWHEESKRWVMFLGGGFYRVYSSPNLINWTLESESLFFEEYPDIFQTEVEESGEKKWVLNAAGFKYYIGSFDGKRFIREEGPYTSDYTNGCQATLTFNNVPDGRTLAIAWMRDGSRGPTYPWRNNMTVVRQFSLKKMSDGTHRLIQKPVSEFDALKDEGWTEKDLIVPAGENPLQGVEGVQLQLDADIVPSADSKEIRLSFLEDDRQHTDLVFDYVNRMIFVDTTASAAPVWRNLQTSMDSNYFFSEKAIVIKGACYQVPMTNRSEIKLKVLIDHSAVEIFLDDGLVSCTFCVYPDEGARGVSLRSDAEMFVKRLNVNPIKTIW